MSKNVLKMFHKKRLVFLFGEGYERGKEGWTSVVLINVPLIFFQINSLFSKCCNVNSTMSTGLNSMTGVIYEDIIKPSSKKPLSEGTASFVMKVIVVVIGIICGALVFLVERLGTLIQVLIVISLLIFLIGYFEKRSI